MPGNYGELIRIARESHDPPMTAKDLAKMLHVTPPFITDIEKGKRLPSLENQRRIKKLLANDVYPEVKFDDLAAHDNDDPRVVAEDIAKAIRKSAELRWLVREVTQKKVSPSKIRELISTLGGNSNVT